MKSIITALLMLPGIVSASTLVRVHPLDATFDKSNGTYPYYELASFENIGDDDFVDCELTSGQRLNANYPLVSIGNTILSKDATTVMFTPGTTSVIYAAGQRTVVVTKQHEGRGNQKSVAIYQGSQLLESESCR